MKKLTFILLLTLYSCASASIKSNKASNFNEKIEKLFVLYKGAKKSKSFLTSFSNTFNSSLKVKNIETWSHFVDPLSLESDEDMKKRVNSFSPNLLMIVEQTEVRYTSNGYGVAATGGTFDIKLFKPNSKSPVWRANLEADGSHNFSDAAKRASDELITKLVADKLL